MDAIHNGDRLELQIQRRIQRVYQRALDKSTKNIAEFLQIVAKVDSGEKKPPAYYQTDEQKARWRQGFLEQEMQRLHVQELITEEIARAGAKAEGIIREATADVYLDNYAETVNVIEDEAGKMGVNVSFAMPKRQEVRTLLDEKNGVFSKIAYRNMGSDTYIRQKLQSEMAQATILGESQKKIIARIQNVTGQSVKQAKRVAQTERNRVQSQARYDAAQEAAKQGVETYNEWRCRFVRSRDTHMARHGVRVKQGECFPGCNLRYPGDINGSAAEVINCHCYLQVGVLLPGEKLNEDGSIGKADSLQSSAGSGTIEATEVLSRPFENGRNLKSGDQFYHAGQVVTFGSWQGKPETIAGKGTRRKIDDIEWLQQTYKRFSNDWKKKKQRASVTVNGERGSIDIHWYEEPTVGKVLGKVKEDAETCDWFYPDG